MSGPSITTTCTGPAERRDTGRWPSWRAWEACFRTAITLMAMGLVLIPYGLWLPVVLLASTLPALYVVLHFTLRQHQWRLRTTPDERRTWYYDWVLTTGETAAEVRLFGLGGHFQALYQALRRRLRRERLRMARHQVVAELGAGAVALLATGGAMAWMIWQASQGRATLGDLALFYQAFHQGQRLMHTLLQNVGQLYANSLFLGNLFEFLALEPKVIDPPHPRPIPQALTEGIRFEQVAFRYPGSERLALEDFNLTIPAGQLVALVGPNGAGKSTLVKLLCRFYDPEAGRITLDGIDLRDLALEDLRSRITVLFQTPVHYNATVGENIALGDLARGHRPRDSRRRSGGGADETIDRLPRGYDQLLGNWFESGTELSVGRVAAHRPGPRLSAPGPDHRSRRADQRHGPVGRGRLARAVPRAGRRPDRHLHHPPVHDRHARGYHPRHGRRPDRRVGLSPGIAGPRRPLCPVVGHADLGSQST